jgi:hypothetical protein
VSAIDPEEVEKVKQNEEELKKKLKEQQKVNKLSPSSLLYIYLSPLPLIPFIVVEKVQQSKITI